MSAEYTILHFYLAVAHHTLWVLTRSSESAGDHNLWFPFGEDFFVLIGALYLVWIIFLDFYCKSESNKEFIEILQDAGLTIFSLLMNSVFWVNKFMSSLALGVVQVLALTGPLYLPAPVDPNQRNRLDPIQGSHPLQRVLLILSSVLTALNIGNLLLGLMAQS